MSGAAAEDRTQAPSQQRLRQAHAQGQVAQSPALTAAVGLLAATLVLGWYGDDLAAILIAQVRASLTQPPSLAAAPDAVVVRLRQMALAVAWPLGMIVAGAAGAAVAAHQVQVRGLWAPHLLAPDPARLWAFGRGPGLVTRGARAAWGVVQTLLIVIVAVLALRADAPRRQRLGTLEPRALAAASALALRQFTLTLATATLALGLVDFLLQHRRYMNLLHMTPEEQREDLRAMEGDPALRAQRRRIARTLRSDPRETLSGAALVLRDATGLTVVIAGGPPPRRFTIRAVARGAAGLRLRDASARAHLPEVDAPALARRLAGRSPALPLPAEDAAALAALWPAQRAAAGAASTNPSTTAVPT